MNELVRNVVWPAVAGNILWSFLQLLFVAPESWLILIPRLAALVVAGVYLSIDWVNTIGVKLQAKHWKFDVCLATAIAAFAVATPNGGLVPPWALGCAFCVAIVGHLFGAWDEDGGSSSKKQRIALAIPNLVGLILLVGLRATSLPPDWPAAVAFVVAIIFFLALRKPVAAWGGSGAAKGHSA